MFQGPIKTRWNKQEIQFPVFFLYLFRQIFYPDDLIGSYVPAERGKRGISPYKKENTINHIRLPNGDLV